MKFNGKNIIFDDDITLTSEGLEGMKLSDVLRGLYSKTSKLESYMKWLYQYGGVGGNGGGSGSGGQSGYSLFVTLDGIQVTGGTLSLSSGEKEWYDLVVKIQNPGGADITIDYTYYYLNDSGTKIKGIGHDVLNASNSYTHTAKIRVNCNERFVITAQDNLFGIDKQINCNIVTNSYTFNAYLAKDNGDTWSGSETGAEIFANEAQSAGLNIAIDYDVAIPVSTTYNWKFVTKTKTIQGSGILTQGTVGSGKKLVSLLVNDGVDLFQANDSDAGYYSVVLSIDIDMSSIGQISGEPWTKRLTFNLIPQDLYLLVSSTTGTIYSNQTTSSDRYEFNPGIIGFRVNPYRGNSGGAGCLIEYRIDGGEIRTKNSTIRSEEDITDISITDTSGEHEHWIDFRLTCEGSSYPSKGGWTRYYFYVKPLESKIDFPWGDEKSTRAGHFNTYRNGAGNIKSLYNLNQGAPYQHSTSSVPILIDDISYPSTGNYTTVINIGLQLSEINSDGSPIFTAVKGGESSNYLTITQNTIEFGTDAKVSYYFPKTSQGSFGSVSTNEFHLLSIVQRLVKKVGNNSSYEITVYVDGILEGGYGNYVTNSLNFKSFTLQPCNCILNLFEIDYLTWTEGAGVEDLNIYQYWLKYNSDIRLQPLGQYDIAILSYANSFTVTNTGEVSTEDRDAVANIATMCGVPTLVMTIRDDEGAVLAKMNSGYGENDTLKYDVSIEWSDGKNQLIPVIVPTTMPNSQFVASIQGSSTKMYKCKNWNLLLENRSGLASEVARYLYSPNFRYDPSDKESLKTFLPEEEFTLKADVVDSSHSNNTSIGSFVNDITTKFSTGQERKILGGYIKNCLQGFPILVYINLTRTVNGTTTNTYYYQGVYNFNLGRTSYYNLGYKDVDVFVNNSNVLVANAGKDKDNVFSFYQVDRDNDNKVDGLLVAEIQGNSPYFDFSQYDKTILFSQGQNDREYMFGDIEKASQSMTDTEAQDILVNLVEKTSQAGGYLFEKVLHKTISESPSDMYGYSNGYNATRGDGTPANQVPNYKKSIIKKNVGGVYTFEVGNRDKADAPSTAVKDFIGDDTDENKPGFFDYRSLSEYYTICMAFGLVDSVQKNMNIKSWRANRMNDGTFTGKFYAAFYDMDTCLGVNNAGKDTSYFAFSDYWAHDDSNVSGDIITPKAINIYRDYSPKNKSDEEGGGDFYDTASSYLFAVAKYAIYSIDNSITEYWPKRLWALWRTTSTDTGEATAGCLSSAKKFMEKYFQNNLGRVSIPMINMNYRNKYFVIISGENKGSTFSKRNFAMFNGTRIHKAKDWLNGRFHILDAYFNLPDANSPIQYYNEEGKFVDVPGGGEGGVLTEPTSKNWGYSLENNPDITVLQDIFSSDTSGNSGTGTIDVNVKAREFTPLFISSSTKAFRYLLSANKTYKIYQDLSGLQAFKFGGSGNWVEMDSINTIPLSNLYVKSDYLENLSGSYGALTVNGSSINMPSLKKLILTGSNYNISFEGGSKITYDKFPNLAEVSFNGVNSCNVDINGSKLKTLSIADIKSGRINVLGCYDITSLNIGAGTGTQPSPKLNTLNISPVAPSLRKLSWNYTGIESITLSNESCFGDSSITIQNDSLVEEIALTGFATVIIKDCPNLNRISISDYDGNKGDKLKSITIIRCGTLSNNFRVNSDTPGVIDFSRCAYLSYCGGLSQMPKITEVHFCKDTSGYTTHGSQQPSNRVEVVSGCFLNDTLLKYVSGGQIVITGSSTFQNCNAFTMREGENGGVTNLYVKADVTDLSYMFSISGGGSNITRETVKTFIEGAEHWGNRSKITSMVSMFGGQYGITYTENDLRADLQGATRRIDLRGFDNLSNVSSMFSWSGLQAYHPDTLGFGKNLSDITFTNFSIGVNSIAICPGSFLNIIGKITYFGPSDVNYTHNFILLQTNGTRATTVKLKNYFVSGDTKPGKVTTLSGLQVDTSQCSCDLSGLFGEGETTYWPELTEIKCTFRNNQGGYTGLNSCGVRTLPKLKSLYESFNILNTTINLWDFFNWDKQLLTSDIPFNNRKDTIGGYELGCLNVNKTITKDNLAKLWSKVLNSRIKSLENFFTRCSLIEASSNRLEEIFGTNKQNTITCLSSAFKKFTVTIEGTSSPSPIVIGHFLSVFPNATNFTMCFKETNIGEQLPRDFFGRRQIDTISSRSGVYFTKKTPEVTSKTLGGSTVSKVWVKEGSTDFVQGDVTKYSYRTSNLLLTQMFYNVKWERYGNTENDYTKSARCYRPDNDETTIEGNYFTIGDKKYYNGEGGYLKENNKDTVYYSKKSYTYQERTGEQVTTDEDGKQITVPTYEPRVAYYYERASTVVSGKENSEIYDLVDGTQSGHTNFFTIASDKITLYNHTIDDPHNLFIAPDFFYAVNNSAESNITNVFTEPQSMPDENRLEGMIPENLFKNCKSISFTGTFYGLNITPRYWKDFRIGGDNGVIEHSYVYIPQNFTSCSILNESFNFNLNVPGPGTETEYDKYYVMFKNSIPKATTNLSNSLPSDWRGQVGTYLDFGYSSNKEMGTHYNIMIDEGSSDTQLREGIDVTHFSSMSFNYLVNGRLSWVLHGNLFNSGFLVENLRMTTNGSGRVTDYAIYCTNYATDSSFVSKYLIFPATGRTDLSNSHIISFNTSNGLTIGRSQIQGCTDTMAEAYRKIISSSGSASIHINVV